MKEDFKKTSRELENQKISILQISSDFYMAPKRKGNSLYFVKSPVTNDSEFSLALHMDSNRFTDFANGNYNGDCIGFVAYVKGISQWDALKELQLFYGLSGNERDNRKIRSQIRNQQAEVQRKQERKQQFFTALNGEINEQIFWRDIFSEYLQNHLFEPFSSEWCDCTNELQLCEYKLDVLCASDQIKYCRMKTSGGQLPTDRYKWILDCLDILQKSGRFHPTKAELEEIGEQKCFEVNRKQGETRRCNIGW